MNAVAPTTEQALRECTTKLCIAMSAAAAQVKGTRWRPSAAATSSTLAKPARSAETATTTMPTACTLGDVSALKLVHDVESEVVDDKQVHAHQLLHLVARRRRPAIEPARVVAVVAAV